MHTVLLDLLAMEMRIHCPVVNKLDPSAELMMLIMPLLWSVVAVGLVSVYAWKFCVNAIFNNVFMSFRATSHWWTKQMSRSSHPATFEFSFTEVWALL